MKEKLRHNTKQKQKRNGKNASIALRLRLFCFFLYRLLSLDRLIDNHYCLVGFTIFTIYMEMTSLTGKTSTFVIKA